MGRHPERLARVLALSGNTLKNLGQYRDAEAELTAALDLRRAHLPADHPDTAQTMLDLGRVKGELGDLTASLALFREAQESFRRTNAPEAQFLTARMYEAVALTVLGDPAAEAIFREVIAGRQRLLPPHHRDTVFAQMGYLAFLLDHHREGEALALLPPVLEGLKAQPNGQFAQVAGMVSSYQIAVGARMSADKASSEFLAGVALRNAEGLLKQCIANGLTFLPHDHIVLSFVRFELGVVQDRLKKDEEADRTFAELMDALRATTGLAQPKVLVVLESYCGRLGRLKRADEARKLFDEVDAANKKQFGDENFWRPILLLKRVDFEVEYGTRDRAIPFAREALALADKGRLIPNRHTAKSLYEAAKSLGIRNATPEAKALAKRLFAHAHPTIDRAYGNPSKEKAILLRDHGDRLYMMGDRPGGTDLLERADRMAASLPEPLADRDANWLAYYLGRGELARGRYPDAERYFRRALTLSRKFPESDLGDRIDDAHGLAEALVGQGRAKAKEAVPLLEEARRWAVARKAAPAEVMAAERLLAAVRLAAGEQGDYRADIGKMVARYAQSKDLNTQSNLIRAAGLAGGVPTWDAGDSARKMVPRLSAFWHRSRALALLRADDLTGAELEVKKAVAAARRVDPLDEAIRGLAALRRGDIGAARACLWRAESLIEAEKPSAANPFAYADSVWINRLTNDLLVADLRVGLPAPDLAPPPRPVR
jgi:tetratricopeptide (TPR) repeat protein